MRTEIISGGYSHTDSLAEIFLLEALLDGELLQIATARKLIDAFEPTRKKTNLPPLSPRQYDCFIEIMDHFHVQREAYFAKKISKSPHGSGSESLTSVFSPYIIQMPNSQITSAAGCIYNINPHFSMGEVDSSGIFRIAWCIIHDDNYSE